jgi:hypothetical protein
MLESKQVRHFSQCEKVKKGEEPGNKACQLFNVIHRKRESLGDKIM